MFDEKEEAHQGDKYDMTNSLFEILGTTLYLPAQDHKVP